MPAIRHRFPILAPAASVFDGVSTPQGLDSWWSERSAGTAEPGAKFELWFGPGYDWRAVVSRCVSGREFELELTRADDDWVGSRVGFDLSETGGVTQVEFAHRGWPSANDHYRTSCFCWAMYLRLLKRYVETGEVVAYESRLDA
ncbi:MAG: SRPBCC domain-containing protein [Thermoanaerobaculia bacterium]